MNILDGAGRRHHTPGTPRRAHTALAFAAAAALAGCAPPLPDRVAPLTILVPVGPFATVDSAAVAEERVTWWDGDPTDDDACTESFAAVELRRHLARALAIDPGEITLAPATALPESGDVFVLGSRRSNPLVAKLAPAPPRFERSLIAPTRAGTGGRIIAAGRDSSPDAFRLLVRRQGDRRVIVVEGASRSGTLYGTYTLLERLGVRFYGLGDSGITYPSRPPALPSLLDHTESPAFLTRGFWAWEPRGNDDFFLWMARNRMNLWTAAEPRRAILRKLGIQLSEGGHGIQAAYLDPASLYPFDHPLWTGDEGLPPDPYASSATSAPPVDRDRDGRLSTFEAHPEWFGLHGGQRSDNIVGESGDNFCTSNAEAVSELIRRMVADLTDGPLRLADVVEAWPLDGGRWCECDACRGIGSPSDRLLDLATKLEGGLENARADGRLTRDVALSVPAYLETRWPPTRDATRRLDPRRTRVTFFPYFRCYAHAFDDTTCTELNKRLLKSFRGWARSASAAGYALGVGEYYNVGAFKSLPLMFPHVMAEDLVAYRRAGVRHLHYMHAPTREWGTWTVNHAVLARLSWAPETPVDSLLADLRSSLYPTTAPHVADFENALERASGNILAVEHVIGAFGFTGNPEGRLTSEDVPLFPMHHLMLDAEHTGTNHAPSWAHIVQAMGEARRALDAATAACRDEAERARLAEDERRFAYGELTFALYDRLIRCVERYRADDQVQARMLVAEADSIGARLTAIQDLVQVSASHANARDGLDASHVEPALAFWRQKLGLSAAR